MVNPILHVCDKCQRPILIYGRLTCKHVLCFNCASALEQSGGQCGRCHAKVSAVEQAGLSRIFMCSHGGSKYGPDGCRRTYLSERDLQAHIDFRHSGKPPKQKSAGASAVATAVPSAEAIAAATAALVAENHHRKLRNTNLPAGGGSGAPGVVPNFSQPPPPVMTSHRQTNLITVPIQDSNSNAQDSFWTQQKMAQPPPNYYNRPPGHHPGVQGNYPKVSTSGSTGSYNEWSASSRTAGASSGYHRR